MKIEIIGEGGRTTAKINIPKAVLEELYVKQKLSTYEIAKMYNCWNTTIGDKLKEYNIKRRNPKKKRVFSKSVLEDLYVDKKYSITRVAKELGCGHGTIWLRMKEYGIESRELKRFKITKEELQRLYLTNKLSETKIARQFNCSLWAVSYKMEKYGLEKRNPSERIRKYEWSDFSGNPLEKAYLIGFRIGDLHVRRLSQYSSTIGSNTTKSKQMELMCSLFGEYGSVNTSCSKGIYSFSCRVNNSFFFLEPKEDKIEDWILANEEAFFSFLAGYTDAEGNIGVYSNRARYRLGSYDKNLLFQVHKKLNSLGMRTKIRLETPKGYESGGVVQNGDFWRISINYKESLLMLFNRLEPYLKHGKRVSDMARARENILERIVLYGR